MRIIRYIFISCFILMIYFPIANNRLRIISGQFTGIIPSPPGIDIRKLEPWPKKFEEYFNERLEIKPWLVTLNSILKIKTLQVSPNPDKVVIGKDGWLFMGGRTMDEYRGIKNFSVEELAKVKSTLHARAGYAKSNFGSRFYLAIIPVKQSIYPEYLPSFISQTNKMSRTEQLFELFENDSLVRMINIKDELLQNKTEHILFYKSDNHWNGFGAFIGYRKITSAIHQDFDRVIPFENDYFVMDSSAIEAGGEARMMNAKKMFHELKFEYKKGKRGKVREDTRRNYPSPEGFAYAWDFEVSRVTGDSLLPDALIIRDSFSDALVPLLAENFNHSVFIFDAWQYGNNYGILKAEKPKVVLYIVLESNLDSFLIFDQ